MTKTKFVDINGKPLVTRSYHIEINIKTTVTVEAVSIAEAEMLATGNDYKILEIPSDSLEDPEEVDVEYVEIYRGGKRD